MTCSGIGSAAGACSLLAGAEGSGLGLGLGAAPPPPPPPPDLRILGILGFFFL